MVENNSMDMEIESKEFPPSKVQILEGHTKTVFLLLFFSLGLLLCMVSFVRHSCNRFGRFLGTILAVEWVVRLGSWRCGDAFAFLPGNQRHYLDCVECTDLFVFVFRTMALSLLLLLTMGKSKYGRILECQLHRFLHFLALFLTCRFLPRLAVFSLQEHYLRSTFTLSKMSLTLCCNLMCPSSTKISGFLETRGSIQWIVAFWNSINRRYFVTLDVERW